MGTGWTGGRTARPGRLGAACVAGCGRRGRTLTARELGAFFSLLLVAGVETTRNAMAHGLWLLSADPEQGELVRADPDRYLPGSGTAAAGRTSAWAPTSPARS